MFRKYYRLLYRKIVGTINPLKYAKKIGVNFRGRAYIYGQVGYGSEPWIIEIGDNVTIAHGVEFITHDGAVLLFRDRVPDLEITKPIIIGNNVFIGKKSMIMPGVTVGNNVVIGAGSIVTKSIPDNSVVAGIPARVIKTTEEYFEKLQKESLHLGHLSGEEKDLKLKEYYNYKGNSKGIYF